MCKTVVLSENQGHRYERVSRKMPGEFQYGDELCDKGRTKAGKKTKRTSTQLYDTLNTILLSRIFNEHRPIDPHSDAQLIARTINSNRTIMGQDRRWLDIISHFILACTGIGLIIMVANKLFALSQSKQFLLNETKRQTMLNEIEDKSMVCVRN